jgi:alpha-tubulin suppressor-like RCC1 family protein
MVPNLASCSTLIVIACSCWLLGKAEINASPGTVMAFGNTTLLPDLTNVVSVAVGGFHNLALRQDGTVIAWGQNDYGQTSVPLDLPAVTAIAAGRYHSLALCEDGTVRAWGNNASGQTNVPTGLSNVTAIAAGPQSSVAVVGGHRILRWGEGGYSSTFGSFSLHPITSLAAGTVHDVFANSEGELRSNYLTPLGLSKIVAVAARGDRTLALLQDGSVITWLRPTFGFDPPTPVPVPGWSNIVAISCSDFTAVGLRNNGTIVQWQHGGGSPPILPAHSNVVAVSAGQTHHLVIVAPLPSVTVQPFGRAAFRGSEGSLTIMATGNGQLAFQWRKDGQDIPGATSNVFHATVDGDYRCLVTDAFSTVESLPSIMTFVPVAAWGDNRFGQASLSPSLSNVIAVAPGRQHSLALRGDGLVLAWGDNAYGQTDVPGAATNAVGIAAGLAHSLAVLNNGTVVAWGDNSSGQTDVPPDCTNIISVAAGDYHSLALTGEGRVRAWGRNNAAQSSVPVSLDDVIQIAAAGSDNLALRRDGRVVSWGYSFALTFPPVTNAIAVVIGFSGSSPSIDTHGIALRADGSIAVLGSDLYREFTPPAGLTNVASVAAGRSASFALTTNGSVAAWGGISSQGPTNVPARLSNVIAIASVDRHSLALIGDGAPRVLHQSPRHTAAIGGSAMFAAAAVGQGALSYQWLFNGEPIPDETNRVLTLRNLERSHAGAYSLGAINALGTHEGPASPLAVLPIFAWGNSTYVPRTMTNVVAASSGDSHFLALSSDGTVTGWGRNIEGQTTVPVTATDIIAIDAGGFHSLALRNDGTVLAWGSNARGQTNVPEALDAVAAIAAGGTHSMALQQNGTVVCWGDNAAGQASVPPALGPAIAISGGWQHSLALLADGRVIAWGRNNERQTTVPIDLTNAVAISAGMIHSAALRSDGSVLGWGYGNGRLITSPASLGRLLQISATSISPNTITITTNRMAAVAETGQRVSTLSNIVSVDGGSVLNLGIIGEGPPRLFTPLVNRSVSRGAGLVLNASSIGAPPLFFQWQHNGTNIPGATNAAYFVAQADASSAGDYRVLVNNDFETLTSDTFTVDVVSSSPVIRVHPFDKVIFPGGTVRLATLADGDRPLSYQWQHDGHDIPDATNTWITVESVTSNKTGAYSVRVRNHLGESESSAARLDLIQVAGWGSNGSGELNMPASLTNVISIASGADHSLAVNADGTVLAWGANDHGQAIVPPDLTAAIAVSAGNDHSLAVARDGRVSAWGANGNGQSTVPPTATNIVAVSAGSDHSLALTRDGTVLGWGNNFEGKATPPPDLTNAVAIAAGTFHSLALRADGAIVGWGSDSFGQTIPPPDATNVVAISASSWLSVALRADGKVRAWGWNTSGRTNVPSAISNVVAVSASGEHVLALRDDGSVVAWGSSLYTVAPSGLAGVIAISAGGRHSLALVRPPTRDPELKLVLSLAGESLAISVPTESGGVYQLQSTDALPGVQWRRSPLFLGNGLARQSSAGMNNSQQFFRVQRW